MSSRWTAVITSAGLNLLAGVQGRLFNFTKAQCGEGTVDVSELENQTMVSGFKKNLSITSITNAGNSTKVRLQLSNTSILTSFNLYQIGVFAKLDSDPEDVLFMIIQADTPDYIPSATESPNFVNDYVVNVFVGNADGVTGTIDLAAYVTVGQLSDINYMVAQAVVAAETAIGLAQEANDSVAYQASALADVIADVSDVSFQLAMQGLINTDGMKHVIVDNIESIDDVILISGKFCGNKVYI